MWQREFRWNLALQENNQRKRARTNGTGSLLDSVIWCSGQRHNSEKHSNQNTDLRKKQPCRSWGHG